MHFTEREYAKRLLLGKSSRHKSSRHREGLVVEGTRHGSLALVKDPSRHGIACAGQGCV